MFMKHSLIKAVEESKTPVTLVTDYHRYRSLLLSVNMTFQVKTRFQKTYPAKGGIAKGKSL
jgi:hypothetical protein